MLFLGDSTSSCQPEFVKKNFWVERFRITRLLYATESGKMLIRKNNRESCAMK